MILTLPKVKSLFWLCSGVCRSSPSSTPCFVSIQENIRCHNTKQYNYEEVKQEIFTTFTWYHHVLLPPKPANKASFKTTDISISPLLWPSSRSGNLRGFLFYYYYYFKCLLRVSHFLSQFNEPHIVVWRRLSGGPQRAGSSRCAGSCPRLQLLHCVRRQLKIQKYFPTITFPCKPSLKLPRGCYVITNGRGKSSPRNHKGWISEANTARRRSSRYVSSHFLF